VSGVPGGLASGVNLVSNAKAAFESYRLRAAANARTSPRGIEGYARALNGLIHRPDGSSRLFPGHRTCFRVGGPLFVFCPGPAAEKALGGTLWHGKAVFI
jgi:hypothetical protein